MSNSTFFNKKIKYIKNTLKKKTLVLKYKIVSVYKRYRLIIERKVKYITALFWLRDYDIKKKLLHFYKRHKFLAVIILISTGIVLSFINLPNIQNYIEPLFENKVDLKALQSIFLTLGGAIFGSSAIAFSFIIFAMQVNIERTPYGLFRKLLSDFRLIASLLGILFLSVIIIICSLLPKTLVSSAIVIVAWAIILSLIFLFCGYKRALQLINPFYQLELILKQAEKSFQYYSKYFKKTALLHESEESDISDGSSFDTKRSNFFLNNPSWANSALQENKHALSFASIYAKRGDHEVSRNALGVICRINSLYIEAKGKTFLSVILRDYFDKDPLVTDSFINNSLELLKRNIQEGISNGDETLIKQTFFAFYYLILLYIKIEYQKDSLPKYHAECAAAYLFSAIESVASYNMPDVVMDGVHRMGDVAKLFVLFAKPNEVISITNKIGEFSCLGAISEKYKAVTKVGVEQLAKTTYFLINKKEYHDISAAVIRIRNVIGEIAELYLNIPDKGLFSECTSYLASYYSSTESDAFLSWLRYLIDSLFEEERNKQEVRNVIHHIIDWSEGLYHSEKKILLKAISKRSGFTNDVINWVIEVSKYLLALSTSPVCEDDEKNKLQEKAWRLISVFYSIPEDKEAIALVENYRLTEEIFDVAVKAYKSNSFETRNQICEMLLNWGMKAEQHQTGQKILEKSLYGLTVLSLLSGYDIKGTLRAKFNNQNKMLEDGICIQISSALKQKADSFYNDRAHSGIERAMSEMKAEDLRKLLLEISDILIKKERK